MNPEETNEPLTIKEQREQKRQEKMARKNSLDQNSEKNRIHRGILWLFVLFVLIGAVFAISRIITTSNEASDETANLQTNILSSVTSADYARDNVNAPVTLIEYGDYECPACEAFYPVVEQAEKDLGANFKFIFRDFPLSQHPNAVPAAKAAQAAGLQGQFWAMHDMLYADQSQWASLADPTPVFIQFATTLKLNIPQFTSDMNSTAIAQKIQDSYNEGVQYDVEWTPTFFLNNTRLAQPSSAAEFEADIEAAISAASTTPTTSAK